MTRFVIPVLLTLATMGQLTNGDTVHYNPQPANTSSVLLFSVTDDPSVGAELYDDQFATMIKTLRDSIQLEPTALTVVVGGCNAGGFIDDLIATVPQSFSVTASATCDEETKYIGHVATSLQIIPYLFYWSETVSFTLAGPELAWAESKALFKTKWSSNIWPLIRDSPEYASRGSSFVDIRFIGDNPLNKHALVIAGDMGKTRLGADIWANWNEMVKVHSVLIDLGFNTRVFAMKDGLRPDGSSPAIAVDGAATIANIQQGLIDLAAEVQEGIPAELVIWIDGEGRIRPKRSLQGGGGQACPQGGPGESYVYMFNLDWRFLSNGADVEVDASGVEDIGGGVGGVEVFVNKTRVGRLQPGTGTTRLPVPEMVYRVGSNYITLFVDQATTPVINEVGAMNGAPNNGLTGGLPKIVSLVPKVGKASSRQCDRRGLILSFSNDVLVEEPEVSLVDAKDNAISMSFPADIVERMPIVLGEQLANAEWFVLQVSDDITNVITDEQLDGEVTDSCDSASLPSGNGVEGGSAVMIFGILIGDVNGDLQVTTADTDIISTLIGTGEGDPGWNPQADIDCDWEITQEDFDLAQIHIGDTLGPAPCTLDPAGACCLGDGTCTDVLNSDDCATAGGRYRGYGTACLTENCDGACCESDGSCADGSSNDCTTGTYRGDGTTCASHACTGACCMDDSTCDSDETADDCSTAGGGYQGHGTFCEEAKCLKGACCESDASCTEVTENECTTGVYQGDCTLCSEIDCPATGACCFDDENKGE